MISKDVIKEFRKFRKDDSYVEHYNGTYDFYNEGVVLRLFRYQEPESPIINHLEDKRLGGKKTHVYDFGKVISVGSQSKHQYLSPGDIVFITSNLVYGQSINPDYLIWVQTANTNMEQVTPPEGIAEYKSNLDKLLKYSVPDDPLKNPEQYSLDDVLTVNIPDPFIERRLK